MIAKTPVKSRDFVHMSRDSLIKRFLIKI